MYGFVRVLKKIVCAQSVYIYIYTYRYIYIHGARRSEMDRKKPLSAGCVRMYCEDIALLYGLLYRGGLVYVVDSSNPLPFQTCFVKLH